MVIQKGEKEFTITRTQSGWTITRSVGGVKIDYHVPGDAAPARETVAANANRQHRNRFLFIEIALGGELILQFVQGIQN